MSNLNGDSVWMNSTFLKLSGTTKDDYFSENFLQIFTNLNPNHMATELITKLYKNKEKELKGF